MVSVSIVKLLVFIVPTCETSIIRQLYTVIEFRISVLCKGDVTEANMLSIALSTMAEVYNQIVTYLARCFAVSCSNEKFNYCD